MQQSHSAILQLASLKAVSTPPAEATPHLLPLLRNYSCCCYSHCAIAPTATSTDCATAATTMACSYGYHYCHCAGTATTTTAVQTTLAKYYITTQYHCARATTTAIHPDMHTQPQLTAVLPLQNSDLIVLLTEECVLQSEECGSDSSATQHDTMQHLGSNSNSVTTSSPLSIIATVWNSLCLSVLLFSHVPGRGSTRLLLA